MYAIHLADLIVLQRDDAVMRILLSPKVSQEPIDLGGGQFDNFIVPFTCPDDQAEAIVAVLRKRYSREQVRCYRHLKTWKRV